jgi:hypothetical protein
MSSIVIFLCWWSISTNIFSLSIKNGAKVVADFKVRHPTVDIDDVIRTCKTYDIFIDQQNSMKLKIAFIKSASL